MGRVPLSDTIRRRLEAEGRLPASADHMRRVTPPIPGLERAIAREQHDFPGDLAEHCRRAGLPDPIREHRFAPGRRWRFDLAWPDRMLAVEVDGGTWIGGRHTSGVGFEADCVKLNEALCLGWRVLRVTPRHVESGDALTWVERAMLG